MKYKILINNLLKLNVRMFFKPTFKYDNVFIIDNNDDKISKFFNSITYSDITFHKIDTINVDDVEEINYWDRYMMLNFPDEETALYFIIKYPDIVVDTDYD